MSSRQLAEWMAYDQVEPFGELRADYRNGMLISTILKIMGQESDPMDFVFLPDRVGNTDGKAEHPNVARFEEMFSQLNERAR